MTLRRILIADDEMHLTQIVSLNLKKSGAEVFVARNGAELLAKASEFKPDLIITDYQMPVVDGYQACVTMKLDPAVSSIPVIMLTARGHRISPADLAKTNIKLLLPKPFSIKELMAHVERMLTAPATVAAAA